MNITADQLQACGIAPAQAAQFAGPLSAACNRYGIDTPRRAAAFIAQCAHESARFTKLEEDLRYSPSRLMTVFPSSVNSLLLAQRLCNQGPQAIGSFVYANKLGNGDVASGDGWAFRGRGLIQITGRLNYTALNGWVNDGNDFTSTPDLVAQPDWAVMSSAAWWIRHGANIPADMGDCDGCTRIVNGRAMEGAAQRRALYTLACKALGVIA